MFVGALGLQGQMFSDTDVKGFQSMTDEVYVLSIFVESGEGRWTDEEVSHYISEYSKSQDWLTAEASYYGKDLYFVNDAFLENNEIIFLEDIAYTTQPRFIQDQVFRALGYDNLGDFISYNNFDFQRKKLKLVLYVKDQRRSHAYNKWSNSELDIAIVYCRKSFGQSTTHWTISHEMLHQFGAWDLYYGESQTLENAKKASELYPGSIMITSSGKDGTVVDELTAWRIGWNDNFKEAYMDFRPQRRNRSDLRKSKGRKIKLKMGK